MIGRSSVVAALGALLLLAPFAIYADATQKGWWPQFRGPNCCGCAAEGNDPPVRFGPDENLLWKTAVAKGHSSPCIWVDNVFLTAFDEEKKQLQVLCLDRNDGRVKWCRDVAASEIEKVHPVSSPAASTPATDGQRIYVYFGSCGLLCYDFEGQVQWTVPMPVPKTGNGHATSPVVVDDRVILTAREAGKEHTFAFDARTGRGVWKQEQPRGRFGGLSSATPVVWGQQIVLHREEEIVGHRLTDGARVWSLPAPTMGVSTPAVTESYLFVGAWSHLGEPELRADMPDFDTLAKRSDANGDFLVSKDEFPADLAISQRPETDGIAGTRIYVKWFFGQIDGNGDSVIDEDEWKQAVAMLPSFYKDHGLIAIRAAGAGDPNQVELLWKQPTNVPEVPSPLCFDGRVYVVNNGGRVSCLNAETGEALYHRVRLGAAGPYYASPVAAAGRIYAASGKGVVTVFASGDSLKILTQNDLREPIFATPAVLENKLYIRSTKHLYAFGL